ncbi:maltose-binding periplasmic protein, partial [Longilinea arvoryzae]
EPVTLNVWIMDRVGTTAMAEVKTIIEKWAADTGNTVIVTEGNQFEMMNKIPVAIPAGEGPDLFMTVNNYIGGHYAAQLIVPVEDALTAEEKAKYTQGSIDSFTLDGHLLGVPIAADVNALVYNKDLVATPPATMDELVTLSKSLTTGDQYGLLYQIDSFWYSYPFFSAYGGYVFKWTGTSLDPTDIGFDNEGAIEGLKYIRSLVETEKLMPGDVTWEVMNSYFTEGKSAMIITNPAMVPSFKDAGINLGVAPIPTAPNGVDPRPFATYTGFSVSAYSKNQAEAATLAAYLGSNLPLPIYKANPGNIPVLSDILADPSLKDDAELAGWMAQLDKSDPLPSINEMNFVWAPATTAFQSVVQGKEAADVALKAAQALIIQTIAENK